MLLSSKVNYDQSAGVIPESADGFLVSGIMPMTCTPTVTARAAVRVCQRVMRNMTRTQRGAEVQV